MATIVPTRCPYKGQLALNQIIFSGDGLTTVKMNKLVFSGTSYQWKYWNSVASQWQNTGTPNRIQAVVTDPALGAHFQAQIKGISGTYEPNWTVDPTEANDPPLIDNTIAWRVALGSSTNSWVAHNTYAIGDVVYAGTGPARIATMIGYGDACRRGECRQWDSDLSQCGAAPNLGGGGGGDATPAMAALVSEYMGNEDLDGNSKIYGFDFMIDPDDEDKPPALAGLEEDPNWEDPDVVITWAYYQSGGPIPPP